MRHGSRASRRRRIHSGPRVLSAKSRGTRANAGVRTVVAPAAEGRSGSRIPAYTIPIAPSRTGTICHIRFRGARTERSSGTGPSGEFGNHCDRCRVYDKMLVTPTGLRVARGLLSLNASPACLRPYVPPARPANTPKPLRDSQDHQSDQTASSICSNGQSDQTASSVMRHSGNMLTLHHRASTPRHVAATSKWPRQAA